MSEPAPPTHQAANAHPDVVRPAPAANSHDRQTPNPLASLHNLLGNNGVLQRLAAPAIQPKLEVGAPDDKHEQEADAIASAVMRKPDSSPAVTPLADQISRAPDELQRAPDELQRAPDELQRAPEDEHKHDQAPSATKAKAPALPGKGSGAPVPGQAAKTAEPTKKAPGPASDKGPARRGAGPPAQGSGAHAASGPHAAAPIKSKGPDRADPKHKAAHDAKTQQPHKHPDLEQARAKPPPNATAHKPSPKPKTGTKVRDHAGQDKPSPRHAGGPPKHISKPANEAAPPAAQAHQPTPGERKPDDPQVAAKAESSSVAPAVTPSAAQTIQSARGGGRPLSAADRGFFESRLGRDLSGVRVHDDAAAQAAARDVRAKAFTYGQDVFFASGRHQPGTDSGRELMAHELAHTIQQRPGAKLDRKIQRAVAAGVAGANNTPGTSISFDSPLPVPDFRIKENGAVYNAGKSLTRPKGYDRAGLADQREIWTKEIGGQLEKTLPARLKDELKIEEPSSDKRYYLQDIGGRDYIGSAAELGPALSIPAWDSLGAPRSPSEYQVDHILELQLAGPTSADVEAANRTTNMQLLKGGVNGSSGSTIRANVKASVDAYKKTLTPVPDDMDGDLWKTQYAVTFKGAAGGGGGQSAAPGDIWPAKAIGDGAHIKKGVLGGANPDHLGGKDTVAILPLGFGGTPILLHPAAPASAITAFKPFVAKSATFHNNVGDDKTDTPVLELTLALDPAIKGVTADVPGPFTFPRKPGQRAVGFAEADLPKRLLNGTRASSFSPIQIRGATLGANGVYATGQIVTDLPIVSGAVIDLVLDGRKLTISHTFETGDFKLPAPLKVTGSSLTLSASTDGEIAADGRVDAVIDKLGKGYLEAKAGTKSGLTLDGGFKFTSSIFEKADVNLHYHEGKFSGDGELTIGSGKVSGVKKASLAAKYVDDHFEASGDATFDIPGIDSAAVSLSYDATSGLTLSATPKLKALPGIKSGELTVTIKEPAGGGDMKVTGQGTAQPDIPKIDAQLTVDYDDGAFMAKVDTHFTAGKIDGTITAGATNQPLDDRNLPVPGGGHGDKIAIFGSGSATITLADGITGTAGIKLLANGEVEISGLLAVQKNLWEGKDIVDKELLHVSTSVPIFPPVVLHVGAGLHFKVGYGPGILSGSVGITYNPDHEDDAKIDGKLNLHASAYAGLELDTSIGLGLGGPGVSVTGNIVLGGELRINADLDNECDVTWSPSKGLKVTDTVKATLSPQFVVHLKASIELDLTVTDVTLWSEDLGSFPFGSGMQAGLTWPVTYESGKAFEPSVDDIKVDKPDLNPGDLATQILQEKGKN